MTSKQRLMRLIETMFPDDLEMDHISLTFADDNTVVLTMSKDSKGEDGDGDG